MHPTRSRVRYSAGLPAKTVKRIRARIMRVNCMLVRAQAQDLRAHNCNLRAITQEWFI